MAPNHERPGRPGREPPPLRPVETLLLTMLAAGDRHGYGLRQDILEHTGGAIELEPGNLYRHIRRLETAGAVAEVGPRPTEDERRIYYRLTPLGRRLLAGEMRRLRELVRLAETRGIITPAKT
jgi:DNA-binding PadR family transcriptional regulator